LSLRQTSDDDDTTTNRPSPSYSAVVVVASSSPPRGGHFRPLSLHRQWLSAGGGLSAASLKDSNWHVEGGESRQLGVVN
jgi:hypothetical protein